jgi:hypothetical protein
MSIEALASEIRSRFPEISSYFHDGDEDLPYLMMGHIAAWLSEKRPHQSDPLIAQRLSSFCEWCVSQPQGKTASDDVLTVLCVAFYEKLIETQALRSLVPKLMPESIFLQNKDYFISHCGAESVASTLNEYKKNA